MGCAMIFSFPSSVREISETTTTQIDNKQADDTTCLWGFALLSLSHSPLSHNQPFGIPGERSLPASRQSLKDFKDGRPFCLTIAEVTVGLEAVQLDQLPVVDSLKPIQDESFCNANRENDASPLIGYVDNQIMPQFDNSTETNPALENLTKHSPHEVNVSELGKLAQDT